MRPLSFATVAATALVLLAAASSVRAEHEEGMPAATCIVLAKSGGESPVTTRVAADADVVVPVIVRCEHAAGSGGSGGSGGDIELQRVDVTYTIPGDKDAVVPRPHRQALGDACDGGDRTVEVRLLGGPQKKRSALRDPSAPVRVVAHLSFRARQDGGKKELCFGSMEWELEVLPKSMTSKD